MTTIRSHYRYEQFEDVLQKLAYKISKEAVEKLPQEAKINIEDHRITLVETDDMLIRFYFKHVRVEKTLSPHNRIGFDVEKKMYTNSNHSSKISFWTRPEEVEKDTKQVEDFINKLMSDVTLMPRFSLKQYTDLPGIEHPSIEVNE